MDKKEKLGQVFEHDTSGLTQLSRRAFLKTSAVISSGLLMGSTGLSLLSGCGTDSDWKGISFPKIAFHNFMLFDGISNRLQKNRILLVKGDKIEAVEHSGDLSQLNQYKVVDLKGRTLLPGLIDNHVHITSPFMYSINFNALRQMNQQIAYNFRNCIMNGVTTVRDVGGMPGKVNKFRKMADYNEIPGPRVISSLSPIGAREGDRLGAPEKVKFIKNPIIKSIVGGNFAERPTNISEIETACEEVLELGAQWLKTYHQDYPISYSSRKLPNHSDEGYRSLIDIGKKNGIKCALHEPFVSGLIKGVDLGFHTLEHMPIDAVIPDNYIEKFMKNEMAIIPTVMVYGDSLVYKKFLRLMESRGKEYLVPEAVDQMSARITNRLAIEKNKPPQDEYEQLIADNNFIKDKFPIVNENLKKLYNMGASIGVGSDNGGTPTGFFGRFTDELRHYRSVGINNFDVLQMATSINARIIGMQDKLGTIEKGKFADIIAVRGNPLLDLNSIDKIDMVMKGGLFIKYENLDLT